VTNYKPHPVRFEVAPTSRRDRTQVLIRFAILLVVGSAGWSSLFWLLYLGLPVVAALLVSQKGSERYVSEDAPQIARGLEWVAAAYAYLSLLTDAFPVSPVRGAVETRIEPDGAPTTESALLRILTSVPAAIFVALLNVIAVPCWLVGALAILFAGRLPASIGRLLEHVVRYRLRFFAWHLSIVEEYPRFDHAAADRTPLDSSSMAAR
jgi:hypothetical protein